MKPVSTGKRLVTAVVMCGLLVGVSGCESHSVLSGKSVGKSSVSASASAEQRDPNRIYAKHDKGADPNVKHFGSAQAYDDFEAVLEKWGLKQTPDWLEICNQVNVPALRKVGLDPQKDLQNRYGGEEKFNCYWFRDNGRLALYFGRIDAVDEVKSNPKFHYKGTIERDGQTYYMGHVVYTGEGTVAQAFSCSLTFERDGTAYKASFNGKDPKTEQQACDDLINMMSRQK